MSAIGIDNFTVFISVAVFRFKHGFTVNGNLKCAFFGVGAFLPCQRENYVYCKQEGIGICNSANDRCTADFFTRIGFDEQFIAVPAVTVGVMHCNFNKHIIESAVGAFAIRLIFMRTGMTATADAVCI